MQDPRRNPPEVEGEEGAGADPPLGGRLCQGPPDAGRLHQEAAQLVCPGDQPDRQGPRLPQPVPAGAGEAATVRGPAAPSTQEGEEKVQEGSQDVEK